MKTAEREPGLVVVELWNRADRLPAFRRMAILTRQVQISVRAARGCLCLRTGKCRSHATQQSDEKQSIPRALENQCPILNLENGTEVLLKIPEKMRMKKT